MTTVVRCPVSFVVLLALASGCGGKPSNPDAGPLPIDQCIGASDLAIIMGLVASLDGGVPDGGGPDGGSYPYTYLAALGEEIEACSTASTCLPAIITEENPEVCINNCLTTTPAMGISAGCVGCYLEIIRCTGQHCATVCLGNDPVMCEACSQEYCGARMADCSGITGMP